MHTHSMRAFLAITSAFVRRDARIATSYKFNFAFQLTYGFFIVAAFYFIAKLTDSEVSRKLLSRYNTDYFSFILIGVAAAGLMQTALSGFADQMRSGMTEGSLEMTFSAPVRPTWVLVLPCIWSFLFEAMKAVVVICMGVFLFGARMGQANLVSAMAMLLAIITAYSVFGILAASMTMVLKRSDVMNIAFSAATALIGGAFFPVELLPSWMVALSRVLPMTYAYEGLRLALLGGATLNEIRMQLTVLIVFSIVGLPIAFSVAGAAIAKAKRDGSLGVF